MVPHRNIGVNWRFRHDTYNISCANKYVNSHNKYEILPTELIKCNGAVRTRRHAARLGTCTLIGMLIEMFTRSTAPVLSRQGDGKKSRDPTFMCERDSCLVGQRPRLDGGPPGPGPDPPPEQQGARRKTRRLFSCLVSPGAERERKAPRTFGSPRS